MIRIRDQINWIKKANEIHKSKYDYSKVIYKNSKEKIIIICKIHGEFFARPNDHLSKHSGCPKCGIIINKNNNIETTNKFIYKATIIHENKYNYSKVNYINCNTPIIIICPIHGEYKQTPTSHLNSSGCIECGKIKNSGPYNLTTAKRNILIYGFTSARIYILKLYNNEEVFYKIGITKLTIRNRAYLIPYKYEILYEYETSLLNAILMERSLLNKLLKDRYTPKLLFGGHTECLKSIDKININKFMNGKT